MNINQEIAGLKVFFRTYIESLGVFDYLALGIVALLFLFLLFLSFMMAKRFWSATIIGLLSFIILLSGPFVAKILLDMSVRKVEIIEPDIRALKYVDSILIKGKLKNAGHVKITSCDMKVSIILKGANRYKQIQNQLKPYKVYHYPKELMLLPGDETEFRIEVKNFNLEKPYNTELSTTCIGKDRA
jgi:hypothetical protein